MTLPRSTHTRPSELCACPAEPPPGPLGSALKCCLPSEVFPGPFRKLPTPAAHTHTLPCFVLSLEESLTYHTLYLLNLVFSPCSLLEGRLHTGRRSDCQCRVLGTGPEPGARQARSVVNERVSPGVGPAFHRPARTSLHVSFTRVQTSVAGCAAQPVCFHTLPVHSALSGCRAHGLSPQVEITFNEQ